MKSIKRALSLALALVMALAMPALSDGLEEEIPADAPGDVFADAVEAPWEELEEGDLPAPEADDSLPEQLFLQQEAAETSLAAGYALVGAGTVALSDGAPLGAFAGDAIVYVLGAADDATARVLFADETGLHGARVLSSALLFLNVDEVEAYRESAQGREVGFVEDDPALPLAACAFAPLAQEESSDEDISPKDGLSVDAAPPEKADDGLVREVTVFTLEGQTHGSGGGTLQLYAALRPADAVVQTVLWHSSDETVATVSSLGVVTLRTVTEPREVRIEAESTDAGGARGALILTVYPAASGIALLRDGAPAGDILWMEPGENLELNWSIEPDGAMQTASAVSGDAAVASARVEDGALRVEALSEGESRVTVRSGDGRRETPILIKVARRAQSVALPAAVEVAVKKSVALTPELLPEGLDGRNLTWSTANKKIATVSAAGVIKGVKAGKTTVTVRANDGSGLSASVAVTVKAAAVKKISVSASGNRNIDLTNPDAALQLKAAVTPGNASKALIWRSDAPEVARVDAQTGLVTPVSEGTARIVAAARDGSGVTGSITVRVVYPATSVRVSGMARVALKGSVALRAEGTGEEYAPTLTGVTWTSSNKKIATVSASGVVKGVRKGHVVITAAAADGLGASCRFEMDVVAAASKVTVSPAALWFDLDADPDPQPVTLTAKVTGSGCGVVWTSSDPAVASVDAETGVVTALAGGTAKITAAAADGSGKKAVSTVNVRRAVTSLEISAPTDEVAVGKTLRIQTAFAPQDVYNRALTWTSSNKKIATVSASGVVKGVKAGTVTITGVTRDGSGLCAQLTVTVRPAVTKIALSAPGPFIIPGEPGGTLQLSAAVTPAKASRRLRWTSSNAEVATVDEYGLVTALPGAEGVTTITAAALDGSGKKATFKVYVQHPVASIVLPGNSEGGELRLAKGKSLRLTPEIEPAEAANPAVTWTSSNKKIATVSTAGVVKGVKAGTATVTARAKDGGGAVASLKVVVQEPAKTVKLSVDGVAKASGAAVYIADSGKTLTLGATITPAKAYAGVRWQSDRPEVATVTTSGELVPVGRGRARVTAVSLDGAGASAWLEVTVGAPAEAVRVSGLHTVAAGQSVALTARTSPEEAAAGGILWTSSDPGVAVVSASGIVKGVANGRCVITAQALAGEAMPSDNFIVDVTSPIEDMDIVCADEIITGQTQVLNTRWQAASAQLTVRVQPETANPAVRWKSSKAAVAAVDANGVVTAKGLGTATITAEAVDGSGKTAKIAIRVVSEAVSARIDGETTMLALGGSTALMAKSLPENRLTRDMAWMSSDPALAQVDEHGRVTANDTGRLGTVIIRAAVKNAPAAAAEYALEIVEPIQMLRLTAPDPARIDLNAGESALQLTLRVEPESSARCVALMSENPDVAEVDASGLVTARASGTANIVARALDGSGMEAAVQVRVAHLVQSVSVETPCERLYAGESVQLTARALPAEVDDDGIVWSSEDEALAQVDENGLVHVPDSVQQRQTVMISAASADGNAVGSMLLEVSDFEHAGLQWASDGAGGIVITGYTGDDTRVRIPDAIGGLPVTTVATGAFGGANCAGITVLECSEELILQPHALSGCASLADGEGFIILFDRLIEYLGGGQAEVTVPRGVTRIADGAFENHGEIRAVRMPDTVRHLDDRAFAGCPKLAEITCY